MNIRDKVISGLQNYKENISTIETTLERVEVYKQAINNPEKHEGLFLGHNKEPGMPGSNQYNGTSMVEHKILSVEEQVELLKDWIRYDLSSIYPLQIEVEQITGALNALTEKDRFIIECKYFENLFWKEIEIAYNDKFGNQNYITVSGIRKTNNECIDKITSILEPYYMRFRSISEK